MVVRRSVKDQGYEILKERILRGEYTPGSAVNIAQLTAELGVSNTPLREALSKLETEGLVIKTGARHQVVPFSDKLNEDLDQVMTIQALGAIDLCIQLGKLDELAVELRNAYDAQLAAYDGEDFYEYLCKTTDFDRAIIKTTNNSMLLSMFDSSALFLTLAVSTKHKDNFDKNIEEHRDILEAIENRDINLAKKLIKSHYDKPLSQYPA